MKRIEIETWSRRDLYRYFSGMQWPYWAITCELDVSRARSFMKERGIGSYVGMIYLVTKAANLVPELRLRIDGDAVYEHEIVHPSFTVQNDDGRLAFCRTRYVADPDVFIARTREVMNQTKKARECPLEAASQDVLYLSCVPWVHFTSVSHPMNFSPQDAIPRITWGRFEAKGGSTVLAMNLHAHHGLADGAHGAQFMQTLSEFCGNPEEGFAGLSTCPRTGAERS
jgi:chloramphenicol O-acetyltransferase type A